MIGTATLALADRPARLKARVNANADVLMVAEASSIGADGSKATSPQLVVLATVTMFRPAGIGQYAPGSSSWATVGDGSATSAQAASAHTAHRALARRSTATDLH
jgi:hypothetical protein